MAGRLPLGQVQRIAESGDDLRSAGGGNRDDLVQHNRNRRRFRLAASCAAWLTRPTIRRRDQERSATATWPRVEASGSDLAQRLSSERSISAPHSSHSAVNRSGRRTIEVSIGRWTLKRQRRLMTPELGRKCCAEHGLSPEEYERILHALGREPNLTELGIFSVMWSEHCSYKSSRIHLKKLPTDRRRG
jgi:hypothetical protein